MQILMSQSGITNVIRSDLIRLTIYCNNKSCPFKDCERRADSIRNKARRDQVTKIDMQCTCQRYTQYLADQLNKVLYK